MYALFQPLFADNPFDMHHWQTIGVSGEGNASSVVTVYANDYGAIGSRTATTAGAAGYLRTSFGIPRAAPAAANNIQFLVTATSTTVPFKLQGIEVTYEQLTGQRKDR